MNKNKKTNVSDNKKTKKRKILLIILPIIILILLSGTYFAWHKYNEIKKIEYQEQLERDIKNSYNNYVLVKENTSLYGTKEEVLGTVSKGMYLELEDIDGDYISKYFKIKNSDYYIKYTDINKTDKQEDTGVRYKNYIPFNKSVVIDNNTKLHVDENTYFIINENKNLPIIVDETDKYFLFFNNRLVYVDKSTATVIDSENSSQEKASQLAILNYHFVVNIEAGEDKLCEPSSICHSDTQFDNHMKYISDNGFYTITMKELEMFIDGKINLPKKSVVITIDDGWFVGRTILILEKYNVMGTLFLIGSLAPVSAYASPNLEVHSHTWNLHNVANCSGGRSPLLCYNKTTLVEDLKKSRDSLNDTTYFCYPFYDYNNHAISALKEAGFTMALTGGNRKVTRNIDKFKVPRYVVYSTTSTESLARMINN